MPYAWMLASASSDKVILSYKVELDYGYQVTASNGTSTGVQLVSSDKVTENLRTISVPLNGATTYESVYRDHLKAAVGGGSAGVSHFD
jgi:hypothetical protein